MFLINSQIPFLRNSSSMLEPILLPKLQIYIADFPYDPYIHAVASNSGYLLRSRYDCCASFSSERAGGDGVVLIMTIRTHTCASYAALAPPTAYPSQESRLNAQQHASIEASLYTQSVHSRRRETLILYTNTLLLLLPRSARIAPPHSLAQALQQDDAALLLGTAERTSYGNCMPSIFSNARFGRYVVTRFLADANFHGHRPTVAIKPSDSYYLPLGYLSRN